MPSGKPPLEKEEIYKNGNFIISEYDFKVPNGESVWTVLRKVELKTIKRTWINKTETYYYQHQYITLDRSQLEEAIKSFKL